MPPRKLLVIAGLALGLGACMPPASLRDPRGAGQGRSNVRAWLGASRWGASLDQAGGSREGQEWLFEAGGLVDRGLTRSLDAEFGARVVNGFDIGLELGGKWQWLGAGDPRSVAASFSAEVATRGLIAPYDSGLALLVALPQGEHDWTLGLKGGYRSGGDGFRALDDAPASPEDFLAPDGAYAEGQLGWIGSRGARLSPYLGLSVRQDLAPVIQERGPGSQRTWTLKPVLRLELGLQFEGTHP